MKRRGISRTRSILLTLWAVALVVLIFLALLPTEASASGGLMTIKAKALGDYECRGPTAPWGFVITKIAKGRPAPKSIRVYFENGLNWTVGRSKLTKGNWRVAHYTLRANLNSKVSSATAQIYAEWGGQFNLSHGPCPATPTPTPQPTSTPSVTPSTTVTPKGTPKTQTTPVGTPEATETPEITLPVLGSRPAEPTNRELLRLAGGVFILAFVTYVFGRLIGLWEEIGRWRK